MPKMTKTYRTPREKKKMVCQNPTCEKQGKEQPDTNFYNTNSTVIPKYPVCKACLDKIVNAEDLQTVYKILKEMDIAFLKDVWDSNREKNPSNSFKTYLRQMNSLPQYKGMKWIDSSFEKNSGYVDEDKQIYSVDWVGTYTQKDIAYLDNYLKDLRKDFKIVTRNHFDYARKIAKASLAMDKAYDDMMHGNGSEAQYQKLKDVFDSLSRSAQFAESNRSANDVSLGGFGVIFDRVEKHTWIPEHQPKDQDMYDSLLNQFGNINKSL